jgi:hypothetical protein
MLAVLVAMVGACDSSDPAGAGGDGTGSISVLLTDDAGDVVEAEVLIERVELVGGPDGPIVLAMPDGGWVGDLTLLEDEVATLVDEVVVPQGSYSQLRIIIPQACIGVALGDQPSDGTAVYESDEAPAVSCEGTATGDLHMPSLAQTGIKVVFQGPIEIGGDHSIVLLDFDVSESFGRQAGASGMWVMHPTIHGMDMTLSGTVNVEVTLANGVTLPDPPTFEDFMARLEGEENEEQVLEADGTTSFLYLLPGDYDLFLDPPTDYEITTDPVLPIELTVESEGVIDVTIEVLSLDPVSP